MDDGEGSDWCPRGVRVGVVRFTFGAAVACEMEMALHTTADEEARRNGGKTEEKLIKKGCKNERKN